MARRIWWGTWPGAVAVALGSAALAATGTVVGMVGLFIPAAGVQGTDRQEVTAPGWLIPLSLTLLAAGLLLPVLTLLWARRRWAGFVLLGLVLSAVVGFIGLAQLGIV